jgi:hypothetical protein
MIAERKPPSPFDLRVFAVLLCPFMAFIGAWIGRVLQIPTAGIWVAIAVLPVSIAGLISPERIQGLYQAWVRVMAPIGLGVSLILLTAIYFLVVTPMGLCLRAFGVDAASRRRNPSGATYWADRTPRADNSYFHPF